MKIMKLAPQFPQFPSLMDNLVNNFYDDNFVKKHFHNQVSANILDTPEKFVIELFTPGFSKENINISLENKVLKIKGKTEQKNGEEKPNYLRKEFIVNEFERSFQLQDSLQIDNIEAVYKDGILYVYLPKQKQESSSKEITIS